MKVRLKLEALQERLATSRRSQNAWAMRVGLSRGHWSDIVNGRHPYPSAKTRAQMLEAFEAELDELFEIETVGAAGEEVGLAAGLAPRYVIDRLIAEGAMGAVWLARDARFGRQVAIKTVAPEAIAGLGTEGLLREVRRTARLQHPNVLPIFDAGETDGRGYYVMPFIAGGCLRDRLSRQGRMSVDAALPILRGIAAALDHAHAEGVLHCDVKPENVLLAGDHAWVADFGLSRAAHDDAVREWERPPEVDIAAGTPAYVSPEQARAHRQLDARSDVYSLACVAFEMLSGRQPYEGRSTTEIVRRRFDAVPPDLAAAAPGLPAAVVRVIAAAMSVDPDSRPTSAGDLVDRLAAAACASAPRPRSGALQSAARAVTRWAASRAPRRRGLLMRNLLDDLRFSVRSMGRRPLFALVAILTLALGIGANAAIFSVVHAVVLRPLPFPDPDRLLRIYSTFEGEACCTVAAPSFVDLRNEVQSFERLVAYSGGAFTITGDKEPVRIEGQYVSHGFFEMLGAVPQVGRFIEERDDTYGAEPVVVLGDTLWRERFDGRADVVGQSVTIDSIPRTIVGVAPPDFRLTSRPQLFVPHAWTPEQAQSRTRNYLVVVGRLADQVSTEQAAAELEAAYGRIVEANPVIANKGVAVRPVPAWLLSSERTRPILVLWGAVAMVLLVACVNVVNLALARAETRQRELAVRAALGAGRGRLIRHFLTESLVVALVGGAVGTAVAYGGLRVLLSAFGDAVPRASEVSLSGTVLLFALAVSLLTGLVVGFVPALQTAPERLYRGLREAGRGAGGGGGRLRQGLVMVEMALAIILVIGAGLLLRSFWKLSSVDVGVPAERILAVNVSLPDARYPESSDVETFYATFGERLRALPGVVAVSMSSALPFTNTHNNFSQVLPLHDPTVSAQFVEARVVDAEYFATLGVAMRSGRSFAPTDVPDGPAAVVINERLQRMLFAGADAVGKMLGAAPGQENGWEVVGVVADIREHGPDRPAPPTVFFYLGQNMQSELSVAVRSAVDPLDLAPQIRSVARDLDPELALYGVERLDVMIHDSLGNRRFVLTLLSIFAAVALALGAIGIYGVMAYAVARQTREIGLRQALGASPATVLLRVVLHGVKLAAAGIGLGLAGAYFLRRGLESMLFEVQGFDPLTYAIVAAVLGAVAVLACAVPARRAAAVDPMEALRED